MILGIDYGNKYIGLAIADEQINIAHPFGFIENKKNYFEILKKIIKDKDVKKIVIGRPIALSGNITEQTRLTDEFIKLFKKEFNDLIVELFDERMTTRLTKSFSKLNSDGHDAAAAIILQDYLDCYKNKNNQSNY